MRRRAKAIADRQKFLDPEAVSATMRVMSAFGGCPGMGLGQTNTTAGPDVCIGPNMQAR